MSNVDIVNSAKAILSERASDFDAYSAYGEVLDNSIEANSDKMKIFFDISPDRSRGKTFKKINSVLFGDNGVGMNKDTLHHCMQLGYSSRYGNRTGIGRFGVGMTKAAIHECKRVEIFSKTIDSAEWFYVYIDIDEIVETGDSSIKEPIIKKLPKEYQNFVGDKNGTIVVWTKYDRQDKNADDIIEEAKIWIGRTFRKFIFENRKFFINNAEIKAIDPLYLNPEFTNFPEDPKAESWGEDYIDWTIDDPDLLKNATPKKSRIHIRFSLLPKSFMEPGRRIAGDHLESRIRYIDRNEGISILRNNREVRDPENHIPYWKPQFKEIDRWWGCEILFNAELDNWFQVKNIKRGAAPLKELREELQTKINSVRASMVKEVQKHWDEIEKRKIIEPPGPEVSPTHVKSKQIAEETVVETKPEDKAGKGMNVDDEIRKYLNVHFGQLSDDQRKAFIDYFKKSMVTIIEKPSGAPNFFEVVNFGDGKKNITYNTKHVFFERYFAILNEINSENGTSSNNGQEILILIDLLVIAFSLAVEFINMKMRKKNGHS
ncbi:MAG: ATP-binding protein [Ignavibacteriaceae bacterium]|nr:ATP-binding protein [Ignavibacteriaceae bacterium]